MSVNPRNLLLFGLLACGSLVTWFFASIAEEEPVRTLDTGPLPGGYFLLGATLYGTNEAGQTVYRIRADRVEQVGESDDILLDEMRLEYNVEPGVLWSVSARRGATDGGRRVLDLLDGVRAVYAAESGTDQTIFETNALHLDMNESVATTDQPVRVLRGRSELTATGLEVDLHSDDWRLGLADQEGPNVTIRSRL
jgi:LPS export ABC transporter protein LptC